MQTDSSATASGVRAAISPQFWNGKRVYLTGHTGFKGAWFSLWLSSLGAQVFGYALKPTTPQSLFDLARVSSSVSRSTIADIRDIDALSEDMRSAEPEVLFHFAAQSLVLDSYATPVDTYDVNIMGTVNVLQAARSIASLKAIVIITTDKVYENHALTRGYHERDQLGGHDPYSNSKACCELVTDAFKRSFFSEPSPGGRYVGIATARAGNVIGGGDQAANRLVPDFVRSALSGESVIIRNPTSTRPWQHVLEPLSGYMTLARELCLEPRKFSEGWNFGPREESVQPVATVIEKLRALWVDPVSVTTTSERSQRHEAAVLSLDCSKAHTRLSWRPSWTLDLALRNVVEFAKAFQSGEDLREVCLSQISAYTQSVLASGEDLR